jgi:choline dehydrogenase
VDLWALLPFGRGKVHIKSTNSFEQPSVQINFFGVDFDLKTQVESAKLVRKLFQTAPLSNLSTGETRPGFQTVVDGATDERWQGWIWDTFFPVNHPIATCAMMRQDLGGVVDGRLKLYGAQNVRIVDASIVPMQISAHLSSTLYGIAEKAADLIKQDI